MPELIEIGLKRAAITLADELSIPKAAEKLSVTPTELKKQLSKLEKRLCLYIFRPRQKQVELTNEGKILLRAFRESVALHDREISERIQKRDDESEQA